MDILLLVENRTQLQIYQIKNAPFSVIFSYPIHNTIIILVLHAFFLFFSFFSFLSYFFFGYSNSFTGVLNSLIGNSSNMLCSLWLLSLVVWNEKLKFLYLKSNGSTIIKKGKHKRNTQIQLQRVASKFPYLQNSSVYISKNENNNNNKVHWEKTYIYKTSRCKVKREEFNPYLIWRHGVEHID